MNIIKKISESSENSENSDLTSQIDVDELFCKNISEKLVRKLKIKKYNHFDTDCDWEPPKEPGLSNSFNIIPVESVKKSKDQLLQDLNFFNIIKNDISNFRSLNKYQIEYFNHLNRYELIELLNLYNKSTSILIDTLLNLDNEYNDNYYKK